MAEKVRIPGIGQVPKWTVPAGIAGVGVAVILYYRNKKNTTTAPATPTDQYPPDGTVGNPSDPYSTDPATGQTYGDEAVGSGGTFGAFGGGGFGGGGGGGGWNQNTGLYTDPNGNTCTNPGADGYCPGSGSGGPPFSTNAQWSTYVITQLQTSNPSLDPGALTDAIGVYIEGQPATPAQRSIIFDAIAIAGDPPVAGPNGFPPKVASSPGGGGGGNATNPVTGLKATAGFTGIDVSWQASAGATSYTVTAPGASNSPATVTGTSTRMHNEPSRKQVVISVLANPAAAGATPATVTVTTR